jgi:hypothetical protein
MTLTGETEALGEKPHCIKKIHFLLHREHSPSPLHKNNRLMLFRGIGAVCREL